MSELIQIPSNVWDFINKASEAVGRMEAERFGHDMQTEIVENLLVSSPIEQMFLVALHALVRANYDEINPDPVSIGEQILLGRGIHVRSQFQVDQFRVDFLVERVWIFEGKNCSNGVIVELDGHEFHDKDKRQRSYEKARDRHLIRRGFKVLHFTGSDVASDPCRVAHEVMDIIEAFNAPAGFTKYDPADPLAQGY